MWQSLTEHDLATLGIIAAYGTQNDPRFHGVTAEMLSGWLKGAQETRFVFYYDGGTYHAAVALRYDPHKDRIYIAETYYEGSTTAAAAFALISAKCREFATQKDLAAIYASRPLDPALPMADLYAAVHQATDLTVTILRATTEIENLRIDFQPVMA